LNGVISFAFNIFLFKKNLFIPILLGFSYRLYG
jgi:hypothetical protein